MHLFPPSIRKWSVSSSPPSGGTQQRWLRRTSSHIFWPAWRREETPRGSCSPPCGGTATRWPPCVPVTPAFLERRRHLLLQHHWTVHCEVWATRAPLSWLSWVKHWRSYARRTWWVHLEACWWGLGGFIVMHLLEKSLIFSPSRIPGCAAVLQWHDWIRPPTEAEEWASAGPDGEGRGGGERKARHSHRHERDWFLNTESWILNVWINQKLSKVHQSNWYKSIMTSKCSDKFS